MIFFFFFLVLLLVYELGWGHDWLGWLGMGWVDLCRCWDKGGGMGWGWGWHAWSLEFLLGYIRVEVCIFMTRAM